MSLLPMLLGGPVPPDVTDQLLDDVRTGAMVPASSELTFTDADLLRLADREMQAGIVPLVMGCHEEFFVTHEDFQINAGAQRNVIRIPSRAIGGKVRDVALVDAGDIVRRIPHLSLDDLEDVAGGFYVEGNSVVLYSTSGSWQTSTARLFYCRRPSRLVPSSAVGVISAFDPATRVVSVGTLPATFTSSTPLDLVMAKPGYECLGVDRSATVTTSLTFAEDLPADLAVGDYVTLAGESPVPQIPTELHPALAQRVIVKVLEAVGDQAGMERAQAKLSEIEAAALKLIVPRVDGATKKIRNMGSPFRRRRRWYSVV